MAQDMPILRKFDELWVILTALLAAMLLASHQVLHFGLAANYVYWFCRVMIEASLFIAALSAVERYLAHLLPQWGSIGLAIAASLIPFALAITAFDLILGLPELGINDGSTGGGSTAAAFAYELIYLLDNHVALSLLLVLPRILAAYSEQKEILAMSDPVGEKIDKSLDPFLQSLEPPLLGELQSVEAQEHYVQLISSEESRMVLYRFSDVVRQLSGSGGIRVHRSHWVAHAAVKGVLIQGQTMKLELHDGRRIPVSRTFRNAVEAQFTEL